MKFFVKTAQYFGAAILDMLLYNSYSVDDAYGDENYVQFSTKSKRAKDLLVLPDGKEALDPTTDWARIVELAAGSVMVASMPAVAAAPSIAVGDQVTASNGNKTKAKFRLQEGHVYTVDRITAKGNVGLAGLPNDEYLQRRFTKVASPAAPANVVPVDANGNALAVGDTVLVVQPNGKKPVFRLRPNGVATISSITPKGALAFDFDTDNQFLARRFHKVTLGDASGVTTGNLVVATNRRDGRFVLPENTAIPFQGVSVDKGNFILQGYGQDTYSPKRFQKVTLV